MDYRILTNFIPINYFYFNSRKTEVKLKPQMGETWGAADRRKNLIQMVSDGFLCDEKWFCFFYPVGDPTTAKGGN